MNLKLSYFSTAIVTSVIIFALTFLASADLEDPEMLHHSALGVVFVVNVVCYFLSRRSEKTGK
ncbi:MAG TPA: hypothetical protein VLB83_02865 [Candidatus Paceibacterota bacterium]|nr:hypothetical protein [Candidatus Paceibacterota bacterium]